MNNSSDKSLYKIPSYPEAQNEPDSLKPQIKIAYDLPPQKKTTPQHSFKQNKPTPIHYIQGNIFKEMLAKSSQILTYRALAEEEIRIERHKYTRKTFLKKSKHHQIHESNKYLYKHLFHNFKKNPQEISRALIDLESKLGAQIFGPTTNGIRREFFVLDHDSWIWHEEWIDGRRKVHQTTTRYELRNNQVIKVEAGPHYYILKGAELQNFHHAVRTYFEKVSRYVYEK